MTCTATALGEAQATVNPCTLCAPLGAALASAGVRGTVPLLHGGQGCATYIRRYLISHFREPMDIASSSFGESQTVFGGEANLHRALANIDRQYKPNLITVATTCVAETIGEDVERLLANFFEKNPGHGPVVWASTPSFKDGHVEGFPHHGGVAGRQAGHGGRPQEESRQRFAAHRVSGRPAALARGRPWLRSVGNPVA